MRITSTLGPATFLLGASDSAQFVAELRARAHDREAGEYPTRPSLARVVAEHAVARQLARNLVSGITGHYGPDYRPWEDIDAPPLSMSKGDGQ